MLEVEREADDDSITRGRLSTFLSVLGNLNDRTAVDVTSFLQPAMSEARDTRAVVNGSLRVSIGGGFALQTTTRLQYDAKPAPDVKRTDWKIETGVTWSI